MNFHRNKSIILTSILIFLFAFSTKADAWKYTGHVLVAQIAYDNLTKDEKEKANYYANIIFQGIPKEMQAKLDATYPDTSLFVKISGLADYWYNLNVAELFESYKAEIPPSLIPYSHQQIGMWHYIDQPYPQVTYCPTDYSQGIVFANRVLISCLKDKKSIRASSLLMALEEHFLGEIHQPLHTLTHITTKDCLGDRGGNDFCLKLNLKKKCNLNLHQLWDSGLEYFKSKHNILQTAHLLEINYPKSIFPDQLSERDPIQWAKENYQYADFIYNLPEYQIPSSAYYEQGTEIVKRQIALSGYRLSIIIAKFLDDYNKN